MAVRPFKIITLEGLIASGKSTIMRGLATRLTEKSIKYIPEPVPAWQNILEMPLTETVYNPALRDLYRNLQMNNQDHRKFELLKRVYEDPERWMLSFQLWTAYTRGKAIDSVVETASSVDERIDYILTERSLESSQLFMAMRFEDGLVDICDMWLYVHFLDYFYKTQSYPVDGIVYIDCPVDVAMQRLRSRGRSEEIHVTAELQQKLADLHERWLSDDTITVPVLRVQVPQGQDSMEYEDCLQSILAFIQRL